MRNTPTAIQILLLLSASSSAYAQATHRSGEESRVPQTAAELWAGFEAMDRATPLDTEILKTWEEDGVMLHVVRFTVATWKGQTAKLAGYFAYPKGSQDLPAIVQINGGGQKASTYGPQKWARYGYACFNPNNGCQPWDGDLRGLPNTDWASLTPGIPGDHRDGKGMLAPGPGTIDDVVSPRNHQWYPRMVGARRAITFLQSRPEVDPNRVGIRGHSTGGVMTVYTATDPRARAAVPSVGGCGFWWDDFPFVLGNRRGDEGADAAQKALFLNAISCDVHWRMMRCPIFFLGASNDFNSPTENVWRALSSVPQGTRADWVLAAHYNHSFDAASGIADLMWFEQYLKGRFTVPAMPQAKLVLQNEDHVPVLQVRPDATSKLPIKAVKIYYSYERQPQLRFWADGGAARKDDYWKGRCPTFYDDEPLFAFANVTYEVDYKVAGPSDIVVPELTVTSNYCSATPRQLAAAGVRRTEKPQRLIDDFRRGFHDWSGDPTKDQGWNMTTRKLSDPRWVGPQGAKLACEAFSPTPDNWLGVQIQRRFKGQNSGHAAYFAFVQLPQSGWNAVQLSPSDFTNIYGEPLDDWHKVNSLTFSDGASLVREKQRLLPRAGERGVAAIPIDVSSWNSRYYQSSDVAYAMDNTETRPTAQSRLRNLRWECGRYISRPKHYEEG